MIENLLRRNLLEVFNERDESLRLAAMAELQSPDMTFADHDGVVVGRDAVNEKIAILHERTPGFEFREAGSFHEVGNLGTLDWNYGPADAPPVVRGTDVVLVTDGRISALYVYLRDE